MFYIQKLDANSVLICLTVYTCILQWCREQRIQMCACIYRYHMLCECMLVISMPALPHNCSPVHTRAQTHTNTHMHPVILFKQWLMALCNECKGCIVHFNSVHILVSGPGASKTANARLSFPPPLQRQQESERKRKRAKMMWLPSTYSHRINTQWQYQDTTVFNAINIISL